MDIHVQDQVATHIVLAQDWFLHHPIQPAGETVELQSHEVTSSKAFVLRVSDGTSRRKGSPWRIVATIEYLPVYMLLRNSVVRKLRDTPPRI